MNVQSASFPLDPFDDVAEFNTIRFFRTDKSTN